MDGTHGTLKPRVLGNMAGNMWNSFVFMVGGVNCKEDLNMGEHVVVDLDDGLSAQSDGPDCASSGRRG